MIQSAIDFVGVLMIFPFLFILAIAGIAAFIILGLVLLVNGLKSKWPELNQAGRVFKIVKIVVGAILVIVAVLFITYISIGFAELVKSGGIFHPRNQSSSNPEQSAAFIDYLSMLL